MIERLQQDRTRRKNSSYDEERLSRRLLEFYPETTYEGVEVRSLQTVRH